MLANPLDYGGDWSGTAARLWGDPGNTPTMRGAIKGCLKEITTNPAGASRLGQAAEACASARGVAEGVKVSMDIEQLLYEASRLHDAVCLMNRIVKD